MNDQTPAIISPLAVIQSAVEKGADPEKLERLFALYERDQAAQARKAFDAALSRFQAECPPIRKTSTGAHNIKYADLGDIMPTIAPTLGECGLSVLFDTLTDDGNQYVVCIVRHSDGHSENSRFPLTEPKLSGGANAAQVMAAANTYARRNALCNALGLVPVGEDQDGWNIEPPATLSDEQQATIREYCETADRDPALIAQAYGVETLAEIPAAKFDNAVGRLKSTIAKAGKA